MRIGISIITHAGQNIWNNGIGQHVYHLATLFRHLPFVEAVYLLNCGDQDQPPSGVGDFGCSFPLIRLNEATDLIDVAIEMSGALDAEWIARFRARGGRIAYHSIGQPYAALVDHTTFSKSGCFARPDRCDEVWLLEKDAAFAPMVRSIHRCPLHIVPLIWASDFLDETVRQSDGVNFGYKLGALSSGPATAAIFEPNISPIKMGLIPLFICEEVQRRRSEQLAHAHLFNFAHLAGHPTFSFMLDNTDLQAAGKVSVHERDYFAYVMARGANIVVSHQIDCGQNYLYLDALAGGYPLVHNSPFYRDVGYYYPDSDTEEGAAQFLRACREHDQQLGTYKAAAASLIHRLDPRNRDNLSIFGRRLLGLVSERKRAA